MAPRAKLTVVHYRCRYVSFRIQTMPEMTGTIRALPIQRIPPTFSPNFVSHHFPASRSVQLATPRNSRSTSRYPGQVPSSQEFVVYCIIQLQPSESPSECLARAEIFRLKRRGIPNEPRQIIRMISVDVDASDSFVTYLGLDIHEYSGTQMRDIAMNSRRPA